MGDSRNAYSDHIRPLFDIIDIYNDAASFLRSCEGVPRELLLLYAAHFALSEVRNGGFLQLFWNPTGILTPEAIEGFHALGMNALADVFAQAASRLGEPFPREREDRWDALIAASDRSKEEIENVFENAASLYLAYQEVTENLSFDTLNATAWRLAKVDNGGFQVSAERHLSIRKD